MTGQPVPFTIAEINEGMNAFRQTLDQQKSQIETLLAQKVQTEAKLTSLTKKNEALRSQIQSVASKTVNTRKSTESIAMQLDMSGTFHTPNGEKGSNSRETTLALDFLDAGTLKKNNQEGAEEGKMEKMVKEYLKAIEAKIAKIPGMRKPMEEEAADGYIESPFLEEIAMVEVPKRFSTPNMTMYDVTTDPDEHVSLYKQKMMTSSIPRDIREAIMCKGFGATLSGPALTWFINLDNGTIRSFAGMVNLFKILFANSRKIEKQSSDLYRVVQRHGESLRDYLNRFNREKIGKHKCDAPITIEAFRRGLLDHSELYKELTKYPCTTYEDVQAKAMAQVRFEEDTYARKTPEPDRQPRRNNNFSRRDHRFKTYQRSRFDAGSVNAIEGEFSDWREDSELPPKLHEYCFNVNPAGVIRTLNKMGDTVQWPRKNDRPGEKKDPSRWCDFHSDIGHTTDECVALRKEVAYLLKKGYLKELLSDRSKAPGKERESKQGGPPPPPPFVKTICFTSGGSEVCGLTYSAAKQHAKESNKDQPDRREKSKIDIPIMFEESDAVEGHHEGLVILLPVGNCMIKRILVDNGSSANIIMLDTLKHMNIDEKNIINKSIMLVGLSGETKKTSGEITLATYAKGVNLQVKF
ncbi:uncharacterized protein LOC110713575 [Chenopodium quinoa]|uniref:uncharacterized protein LOC110713575 n=1 Tax=Chenopodium quinoa TaxID=63459 RepID=UPI000B7909A2|nr:uncharacterized protein LOC110713575 [Chenopodium quinoa]